LDMIIVVPVLNVNLCGWTEYTRRRVRGVRSCAQQLLVFD